MSVLVAGGFVLIGDLTLIASVTDLAIYLVFIAVNIAVVVLRFRMPAHPRPFRSPVAVGRVPLLPLAGLAAVMVMIPALSGQALVLGAGLCVVGVAGYRLTGFHMGDDDSST